MNDLTLYEILGVAKDALPDDITAAYKQLAKMYHADRNPGDEVAAAHYARVNEAYEVLSDPARRAEYDRSGVTKRARDQRQELLAILVPVMMNAIQESSGWDAAPVTERDLKRAMTSKLMHTMSQIEETRGKMREGERQLELVIGRFTTDDPENLLELALQSQLTHLRGELKNVQDELDRYHRALKYLDGVTYRRGSGKKEPAPADGPTAMLDEMFGRKRPKKLRAADDSQAPG